MSNATIFSSLTRRHAVLGWMLLAIWFIYLITLFPIIDEYLVLSLFTLTITVVGISGAVLALRDHPFWIGVSNVAAALLVIRYIIYWQGIRTKILAESPEMNMFAVLEEIARSGILIFEHKLSQGEVIGATLTMINEFAMPALQIGILIATGAFLFIYRQKSNH